MRPWVDFKKKIQNSTILSSSVLNAKYIILEKIVSSRLTRSKSHNHEKCEEKKRVNIKRDENLKECRFLKYENYFWLLQESSLANIQWDGV